MALTNRFRIKWWQLMLALVIVLGVGLSVTWAFAGRLSAEPDRRVSEVDSIPLAGASTSSDAGSGLAGTGQQQPCTGAFQYVQPEDGAPCDGCTVQPGQHFTLDLMVNTGSDRVTAQQSFLAFDSNVLHVVDPSSATCTPVQSVTADTTEFDAALQNEVCNGPEPCTFGGQQVKPGTISYASGTMATCPQGCQGDIRVAEITFCAVAEGKATLRWEFSPAARTTSLLTAENKQVSAQSCYADYSISVATPK